MWHPDIPEEYRNKIVTGDARELAKRIPDESIDLIFTDPPYPRKYLYLFEWLSREAARVLKSGMYLMSLCGHNLLPEIMDCMRESLEYVWTCGMGHGGSLAPVWPIKVWAAWKPMVWFSSGGASAGKWLQDFYRPDKPDKRFHVWGQAVSHSVYYIDRTTSAEDIVFDPFCGGGTVPAACKILGRNYIAFEIDPDTAEMARERVLNTQPPLFVPEPEQLKLD